MVCNLARELLAFSWPNVSLVNGGFSRGGHALFKMLNMFEWIQIDNQLS